MLPNIPLLLALMLCSIHSNAINLNATYDPKHDRVNINWAKEDKNIRRFVLQKSTDQYNWKDIAYQTVTDYNSRQAFRFFDEKPSRGKNYYRLKSSDASEQETFSKTILVLAEPYTFDWTIYPIPVGEVFTLQYKGTAPLKGVVNVSVINMQGKIMTSLRFASNTTNMQIHTNMLFRGVYVLKIIVEDELIFTKQFVK